MTPDDRPPLDYEHPRPAPNLVAQCILSTMLTAVLLVGGIFLWLLFAFSMSYRQAEYRGRVVEILTAVVGIGALVGLNVLAYRAYRNPRRRGVGLGIWIGLGVALLVEGACFSGKLT